MTITARTLTWTLATLAIAASMVSSTLQGATDAAYACHVDCGAALHHNHRVVVLNDSGTAFTPSTLLSAPFHAAGPVTVAWKVAAADAPGYHSYFAVALMDAQGRTRARLAATTRAGRASATTDVDWQGTCYLKMSVANMEYAIVGYTLAPAR